MNVRSLCKHRTLAFFIFIAALVPSFGGSACTESRGPAKVAETAASAASENAVNINTASPEELQKIPHIGPVFAQKIIEYRTANGPFKKAEHLMMIQGISDDRFRRMRPYVRVD